MISENTAATPYPLEQFFSSDNHLHLLYPASIQLLAARHWTPLHIARLAAQFLGADKGAKVLDIGSGAGKFCLAAGYYKPEAVFYGVEQRKQLVKHAQAALEMLGLANVHFLCQNLTQLDFTQYDHFYFYNSFYENLEDTEKIDDSVLCSPRLYDYYHRCLYKKLNSMPAGTKLATYHTIDDGIPLDYHLVEEHLGKILKCWVKI
jgi:SAM-dependent methyltransferase